jgi:microcystin-dependent protein
MNRIFAALLALVSLCAPSLGATLLPPGQQVFIDVNGKPLAGGTVQFLVPNTTTAKQTWKDAAQTILNTNPVRLDAAGRATIYGAGAYRQIVKDAAGNLIWDQLTADTSSAQISWGGTSTGTPNAQIISATNFTNADGQIVAFIAGFTNTGQLTVAPNGAGSIAIVKDTLTGPVNLTGLEVSAGATVLMIYDAARGAFHLVGGNAGAPGFGAVFNVTAANVTDIGLATSHNANVTGNATIVSFGSSASTNAPIYVVSLAGSGTLVNGANLALPGGANIFFNPGDSVIASYSGAGAWRVLSYSAGSSGNNSAGTVFAFAGGACPAGSLFASGTAVNRADFPGLFTAIGSNWGAGDGSSTFNLPDLRGYFLRGVDSLAGRDPGRALYSAQGDQVGDHTHTFNATTLQVENGTNFSFIAPSTSGVQPFPTNGILNQTATETRPENVAVLYCVKF